jgi:hypothetical protein
MAFTFTHLKIINLYSLIPITTMLVYLHDTHLFHFNRDSLPWLRSICPPSCRRLQTVRSFTLHRSLATYLESGFLNVVHDTSTAASAMLLLPPLLCCYGSCSCWAVATSSRFVGVDSHDEKCAPPVKKIHSSSYYTKAAAADLEPVVMPVQLFFLHCIL